MSNPTAKLIAATFTRPYRTKMPKTPADYGMDYETLSFPAEDGIELSAWYMARPGNKLALMNHPLYCSKYGFVPEGEIGKLVPVHVEFLKTAKHLYDAGYSILFYDLRNHGQSAQTEDGLSGIGALEWQDVAGAMHYINAQPNLKDKDIALVNHCMGANSAIIAMSCRPELFGKVKVLVAVQPISMKYMAEKMIPLFGGGTTVDEVSDEISALAGFNLYDMSPNAYLKDLKVPVLYSQVREDVLTSPADLQAIYDATPTEKELVWIEGPLNRFDGYNYFGDNPQQMLDFINKYMNK